MTNEVSFFLNGKPVTIKDPAPDLLLIDYLRSPDVALAGPKKPCGQGGCGGCTVILSRWNGHEPEHRAINSCLRPVCALGGLVVTTVEGTGGVRRPDPQFLLHAPSSSRGGGSPTDPDAPAIVAAAEAAARKGAEVRKAVAAALRKNGDAALELVTDVETHPSELEHTGVNPVAQRLAINNGSQCGYCSVGFVMNMSEFITNHPEATKKEIEEAFDGNLCRCTGYRAILTGMKTFASDWTAKDEAERMKCLADDGSSAQLPGTVEIPFPPEAKGTPTPVDSHGQRQIWRTATTLAELAQLMTENRDKIVRLVHGNTSFGVYTAEYPTTKLFIDVRLIPELYALPSKQGDELTIGAGNTYNDLVQIAGAELKLRGLDETTPLGAIDFMARRTAGRIVRNAASLGGNTMLVLKHIYGHEDPFPSDVFTALVAVDARISYLELDTAGVFHPHTVTAGELTAAVVADRALADRIVLAAYHLPRGGKRESVLAQKVALREVNAHSIVNSTTRFVFKPGLVVEEVALVFGGIAPYPWRARATEALTRGKKLSLDRAAELAAVLAKEVRAELKRWAPRMAGLPSEGFTDEYRTDLATGFLYKAIVNALLKQGAKVPPDVVSSGLITWGRWPASNGRQYYEPQNWKAPVAQPYVKTTAIYQTSGLLHYTHELPVPPRTLNGAFVQSRRALATCWFVIPGSDKKVATTELRDHLSAYADTFVDLITYENIRKGGINNQGMGLDQPLFAQGQVNYVGQSIAVVLATNEQEAQRIADYVAASCIGYGPINWPAPWNKPVLDLDEAIKIGSVYPDTPASAPYVTHIWKVTRPGSTFGWMRPRPDLDRKIATRFTKVNDVACVVVEGSQTNGGQVHFYMEPQACIAEPTDEGRMIMHPSSQSPMEMHQTTAMALAIQYNLIDVQIAPVGGAFGGKTEQARFVTGPAAVAAQAVKRPVRLVVPRDEDTSMIGKRHAYYGQYQVAVDRGLTHPERKGRMLGFHVKLWGDGGAFYDCSFIVSNCIQLRTDNAYLVPNFESVIDVCRTNTAPSTAMRSFGDVQGKNIVENAVDDAAFAVGMLPEDMREINLYDRGDVTPFGQALSFCYIKQVWQFLKDRSKYAEKRASVDEYNRKNKWTKRGLAMIPVKYGSGYNFKQLEQSAAFVVVNQGDGSITVHHGGVEGGQGLATQVLQVASYVLNVPMSMIFVDGVKTSIIPNPTSTGASTGTPYSCEAVKQTCQVLRERLTEFGYKMLKEKGDDWCHSAGIDFWNYGLDGWAAKVKNAQGLTVLIWQNLVQLAYTKRVNLLANFSAKQRGGGVLVPTMTFKPQDLQPNPYGIPRAETAPVEGEVDSFVGFTYSAALSVVEVDILTGEVKILSSDLVYDMGWSMNPALDIGQVEGAFIQGVGYLMTEKLVFQPDGEEQGRLNTTNTWRYKIPAVTTIPLELNVHLFPRNLPSVAKIPDEPHDIFSAKEVGEPPLVLANTVFFAVKAAIRASRLERGLSGLFRFDAPATVQEVRRACEVSTAELG